MSKLLNCAEVKKERHIRALTHNRLQEALNEMCACMYRVFARHHTQFIKIQAFVSFYFYYCREIFIYILKEKVP